MTKNITFDDLRQNEEIKSLIDASSNCLKVMNYTEHGMRHAAYVSRVTHDILKKLGLPKRTQELGRIAGYIHDVGNMINRLHHGKTAAILVYPILKDMGMPIPEICAVCSAIGNHEEEIGYIVNDIGAALVIADKSDAHRTRVQQDRYDEADIHDRVNFSILKNIVVVNGAKKLIDSKFYMDKSSSVMEYFQIYLDRIVMSEKAANFLGCSFQIYINDVLINRPKPMTQTAIEQIEEENA